MIRVQPEACSTDRHESNEAYECHEGNEILRTNGAGLDEISMLSCSKLVPSAASVPLCPKRGRLKIRGRAGEHRKTVRTTERIVLS